MKKNVLIEEKIQGKDEIQEKKKIQEKDERPSHKNRNRSKEKTPNFKKLYTKKNHNYLKLLNHKPQSS